jgi:hypothetical protein
MRWRICQFVSISDCFFEASANFISLAGMQQPLGPRPVILRGLYTKYSQTLALDMEVVNVVPTALLQAHMAAVVEVSFELLS